jgi:5-methylcytosine-specific restriction enzyme subunit McrC
MTHWPLAEWGRVKIGGAGPSRAQADALLRAARAHPVAKGDGANILHERNGHLHAAQTVGVLSAAGCSLEILPKVDPDSANEAAGTVRARLVEMLDVALDLKLGAGEAAAMARGAPSLLDILIRIFADRLLAETRRGLPRAYLPCEDDLPTLRGRLDVRRQFTVHAVRPDRLACRYDVLSADTPILQLMKACVVRLAPFARRFETRRLLDELRIVLADVSDVPPDRLARKIVLDRTNSRWRVLLTLARLLLGREWQDTRSERSAPEGFSLLFPMNELFESYVAVLARRALAPKGIEVQAQGGFAKCLADWIEEDERPQGKLFATKPDLILKRNGKPVAIVDTKWKAIGRDLEDRKRGIAQGDVYQMMAYAQLYRVERLMLLYPHHPALPKSGTVAQHRIAVAGGARLDVATIDVGSSREGCVEALRNLLGSLAPGLGSSPSLMEAAH